MKKLLATIIAAMLLLSASVIGASAWIGDIYKNEEEALTSVMNEMEEMAGITFDSYTYERIPLYNTAGEISGCCYDVTMNTGELANILMNKFTDSEGSDWFEVTEINIGSYSPYRGLKGTNLYPTATAYVNYDGGVYKDLRSGDALTLEEVQNAEKIGFGIGYSETDWEETIKYAYKTISSKLVPTKSLPCLSGSSLGSNCCGPMAGGSIISYWDRTCIELIPNYEPGEANSNGYYYWNNDMNTQAMVDELYVKMQTNVNGSGTTIEEFKEGLTDYVKEHGNYTIKFTSMMQNGKFSTALVGNHALLFSSPIALFLNPYYNTCFVFESKDENEDNIVGVDYTGGHMMVAAGTVTHIYKDGSQNVTATRNYLSVYPCTPSGIMSYMNLDRINMNVYDGLAVKIS